MKIEDGIMNRVRESLVNTGRSGGFLIASGDYPDGVSELKSGPVIEADPLYVYEIPTCKSKEDLTILKLRFPEAMIVFA